MFYKEFFLVVIMIAFSACQTGIAENDNLPTLAEPSPTPVVLTLGPNEQQNSYASIKKVDFRNFTYTGPDDYSESFTLKNGEKAYVPEKEDGVSLGKVSYDDVTSDGREEAVVSMSIQTGGTAIPSLVFIFTLEDKKLRTLWKFMSGDRAEGGLKDVYSKDGILIVELFGDNKFLNGKWESSIPEGRFKGFCCPTVYTKTKFKWNGEQFAVDGIPEIFDIAEKAGGKN